jgi:hypothetical protein
MNAKSLAILAPILLLLSAGTASFSQTGGQPGGAPLPPPDTAPGQLLPMVSSTPSTPAIEAQRAEIWNSPTMLRARAWAQEYFKQSARITPEEARDYMAELQRMSPTQMKLWLLKFEHEQEMVHQQQAAFNQQRQAGVQQAMAMNQSIQQAYGRINQDETEAAQTEEASIQEQQQNAQQNADEKEQNLTDTPVGGAWGPYGYGGYGYGPYGYGGGLIAPAEYHYHFHY